MNTNSPHVEKNSEIPNERTRAAMAEADEYIAAWKKRMEQE